MITLFNHQAETKQRGLDLDEEGLFDWSDPGTGKTIAHLSIYAERLAQGKSFRLLVLCPKSIMQVSWLADIRTAFPHLTAVCAFAHNREKAFKSGAQIVVANHDAVTWLAKRPALLMGFSDCYVDESTAFKNPKAQRTKALLAISKLFKYRHCLSGTPAMKSVLELWSQAKFIDGGARLGDNFYRYRAEVTQPVETPFGTEHPDRPGAMAMVSAMLSDITIRHDINECLDLPEHIMHKFTFDLETKHLAQYDQLRKQALILLENGEIVSAQQRSALRMKLRQAAVGVIYDNDGNAQVLNSDRCEILADMAAARGQVTVPFMFQHQLPELRKAFKSRGIETAEIHSKIDDEGRRKAVEGFQAGDIQAVFFHPASAAHGITLTAGRATLWSAPTDSAEHFVQSNRRIYRAGVKHRTETVMLAANLTLEDRIYSNILGEVDNLDDLYALLA